MKKFSSLLAIALTFVAVFFAIHSNAAKLEEGVHYEVIGQTATAQPEVKEFFSYYCPHCMAFEPLAKKLKQSSATNGFKFVKSHVDFLRAAGPEIQTMLTKALITAEKLNVPQVSDAIFDRIHNKRKPFTKEQDVKELFLQNKVSAEAFDKAFNSFGVKAAASKMKKAQDDLSKKRVLTGVPTFIVNGKYKLIAKGFGKGVKSNEEFFNRLEAGLIELSAKK